MNYIHLIGKLGRDPEISDTTTGKTVAKFSLAVKQGKGDPAWFECEAWQRTAEIIRDYVQKGHEIGVSGKMRQDSWEDKETKKKRTKFVVSVSDVTLLKNGTAADKKDDDLPF